MAEEKTPPNEDPRGGKMSESQAAPANLKSREIEQEEGEEMATTEDDPLLNDRQQMYQGFIRFSVFGTAAVAIVLILLAIFLV